jgi:hypothetical protein
VRGKRAKFVFGEVKELNPCLNWPFLLINNLVPFKTEIMCCTQMKKGHGVYMVQ